MSVPETIIFTRGVPATESFPTEDMAIAAQEAIRAHGDTILQYGSAFGFQPLREWLAKWHDADAENVLCSNGSLQIIEFICTLLLQTNSRTVFVEAPTYDRTITILRKYGAEIVSIPLQSDGPDMAALEAALRKHRPRFFYIIPDFQNPAGATCSGEKRRQLVALAREHGFLLLEDSPYRELRYRGEAQPCLRELAPEKVMQFSSFSKLIGPGPRLGYVIGPQNLLKEIAREAENNYITPGLLAHGSVYEFCRAGKLPAQIEKLKKLYAPRLEATLTALDEYLPESEPTRPDGGFFLSLTLPEGVTTMDVRARAAEVNLQLADGRGFFADGGGERFLRLPFCALTPQQLQVGVARLADVVRRTA